MYSVFTHWEYIYGILRTSLNTGNQKPLWHYVKSQKHDRCGVSPVMMDRVLHANSADKAQMLNGQFSSVFTDDDHHGNTVFEGPSIPLISKIDIQVAGEIKLLKNINP